MQVLFNKETWTLTSKQLHLSNLESTDKFKYLLKHYTQEHKD